MEVLVGTRVLRGPDWSWRDQDGGEGHLGTVAEVQASGEAGGEEVAKAEGGRAPCIVTVQWDCGGRCRYRCGLGGKYDLRGFDSGPAGVVHSDEACGACGLDPITGIMWKCARCLEYSICTDCYMSGKHILYHEFDRFVTSRERVRVPARGSCKRREVRGMFKYAEVVPWCDWEPQEGTESVETGEIVAVRGKDNDNSRGFVEVEWKEVEQSTIHMVGHKGKVELKCTEPTSGGYYYPDHLPLLGAPPAQVDPAAVSTGDRVRVELEPEVFQAMQEGHSGWNELLLNVIGKVGTVVGVTESGDLKVRYTTENLVCTLCAEAVVKVDMPRFKVGDLVKVSSDMEKMRSLQQGHGDWSNAVLLMMGEVGRVYAVYTSGDVMVVVKGKSWVFNPLCLSPATEDEGTTDDDNPFAKWAKKDVDDSIKIAMAAMLQKGQGETMLMATSLGEVEILREFLTRYPEMVNFTSDGRTALHCAASAGLVEPLKILIEFKADIEQMDDTSIRALHTSVSHGSEETTQLLVNAGADVNARTVDGSTAAMFAALHGKPRTLKVLLSSPNIDVAIQDEMGNTALHAAVLSQKLPCIRLLLDRGADPCMLNFNLMTPLHYAARMGFLPVVEAFLEYDTGCANAKDGYSYTILHCAAFQDHLDIITLAMETRGCNVDAQNDYGQTPLHIALARGNTKSIEKLVMYEASVNAADLDGCTSLHYITSRTDGVEPPTEDSPVTYKLFRALFGKYVEDPSFMMYGIMAVSALLLRKGADIHIVSQSGRSPYQILPFLGTLMTVLADYEEIIDEGGHPDGSPLLRLTNKQGGRIGKKHHHSSVYQEGGGHEDYEGVGHGSSGTKTVMLICTPSGYGEDSTGTALMGKKEKTGRGSGASFGGADIYQDYNHTYSFSVHAATSGASGSKPTVTTSMSDSAAYAGATGGTTAKGATGGTTATKGATGGTTATKGATGGATATKGATGGTTAKGATGGATGMGYSTKQPWSTRSTESGTASRSVPSHPDPPPPHPSSSASLYTASSNAGDVVDEDLCCMCDNAVDSKFYPCGHASMCSQCASRAKRCPLCKTGVSEVYNSVCVNCRKRESKVRQNCGHWMCNSCQNSPVCAGCNPPD